MKKQWPHNLTNFDLIDSFARASNDPNLRQELAMRLGAQAAPEKLVRLPSGAWAGNGWVVSPHEPLDGRDMGCSVYHYGQFIGFQNCTADQAAAIINGEKP